MDESRSKVLIVDDEPVICQLLESELGEQNYLCKTAFNGNDALKMLKTDRFDLVLLDIKLPDMSGMHLLGEIVAKYSDMPVIMVTGVIDIDTAVMAIKMGASDYIVKPFDLNKLTTCVARTIFQDKSQGNGQARIKKTYIYDETKKEEEDLVINELNAISQGVEQRVDHIIGSSKIVTERTVQIARRLKIPEEKIRLWKARKIESGLDKRKTYHPIDKEYQKSVTCALMNAINLLIDKD